MGTGVPEAVVQESTDAEELRAAAAGFPGLPVLGPPGAFAAALKDLRALTNRAASALCAQRRGCCNYLQSRV